MLEVAMIDDPAVAEGGRKHRIVVGLHPSLKSKEQ